MNPDNIEKAVHDRHVSRRRFLRGTANLTAGAIAVTTLNVDAAAAPPTAGAETALAPDHDPATGEIFDRDRHHHWDTV